MGFAELLLKLELRKLLDASELFSDVSELDATDVVIGAEDEVVPDDEPLPQLTNKQVIPKLKTSCVRVITVGSALVLYYLTLTVTK